MANEIHTSSKGGLAKYCHHPLDSPPMGSMLNALINHQGDLITKYLEPSTATAKGHMVRIQKTTFAQHRATNWIFLRRAKR